MVDDAIDKKWLHRNFTQKYNNIFMIELYMVL
jgi:hypothetical protein